MGIAPEKDLSAVLGAIAFELRPWNLSIGGTTLLSLRHVGRLLLRVYALWGQTFPNPKGRFVSMRHREGDDK
jgi:hypothetical protein